MGIIENVDFNNLNLNNFTNFKCLCELCDDGCFDRMKQTHHPECKRKFEKKVQVINKRPVTSNKCYLTHYKETFISNYNPRPSTAYVPPKDLFLYVSKGSIDLNTIQKTDFKAPEPQERAKPIKTEDNYQISNQPFNAKSYYQTEYFNKENNGLANIVKKNSNESTMKIPIEKISKTTTNQEHFKDWNLRSASRSYSEYPSYAGESLFPTKERNFNTSTKTFHQPIDVTKLPQAQKFEMKGSLVNQGDMELETNYRKQFVKFDNADRAKKVLPSDHSEMISSDKKVPISSTTQNRSDFIFYHNSHPATPADCNPYYSDLNLQIYPGKNRDHNTNYSLEFVAKEPTKAKSCKKPNPVYEKPTEKIQTETVTKTDFKPIDLKKVPALRAQKVNANIRIPVGPMESKTMTMTQFVPYEVKPMVMAKDPNPYYYIPSKSKFESETTTGNTFKGEKGYRSQSFKPDYDNIKIDKTQTIDTNTNYKAEFKNHGLTMCEAKAFLIANSLATQREIPPSRAKSTKSLPIPKVKIIESIQV